MNPDTKAIAQFETDEDAESAGHTVKLTEAEAVALKHLGRHERDAALSRMRDLQAELEKFLAQKGGKGE